MNTEEYDALSDTQNLTILKESLRRTEEKLAETQQSFERAGIFSRRNGQWPKIKKEKGSS